MERTIRRMLMKRRRRKRSRKWPVLSKEEEEDEEKDGKSEFIDVHKNAGKCQKKRVVIIDSGRGGRSRK